MGGARRYREGQRGFTLIEQVVSVALVGAIIVPLMTVLSVIARGTAVADTEVVLLSLAQSQIESVKRQDFEKSITLQAIASDDFESADFTGGTGWVGSWSSSGEALVTTSGTPYAGS